MSAARESEVSESDVGEEAQALADFAQDALSDSALCFCEGVFDLREPLASVVDGKFGDLADMLSAELDAKGFGSQAMPAALSARSGGLEGGDFFAYLRAACFAESAVEVLEYAAEVSFESVFSAAVSVGERDDVSAGSFEDDAFDFWGKGFAKAHSWRIRNAGRGIQVFACTSLTRRRCGCRPAKER